MINLNIYPCDLPTAPLTQCRLFGTWTGMSFRGVCLWECDLSFADLTGADLRGCYYDAFTRWPAGFDPRAAGARLVD